MKVAINRCYGGFSLSPAGVKRLAELQGRPCYFFTGGLGGSYMPTDTPHGSFWHAFDIPNPNEMLGASGGAEWYARSPEEQKARNERYKAHTIDDSPDNRHDPLLIQVVEELGEAANGNCAEIKIVDIPDGVEYDIEEYDGLEWVAEKHRTWGADL